MDIIHKNRSSSLGNIYTSSLVSTCIFRRKDTSTSIFRNQIMMGSITEQHMATEVPVLIVGGGPTGLLAAYLLSKFGGTNPGSSNFA